jgi:hypothetical protein
MTEYLQTHVASMMSVRLFVVLGDGIVSRLIPRHHDGVAASAVMVLLEVVSARVWRMITVPAAIRTSGRRYAWRIIMIPRLMTAGRR